MMLVSPFAFCDDKDKDYWKTSYFKVKSDNLNVFNFERNNEKFHFGFFINPDQEQSNFNKDSKEKEGSKHPENSFEKAWHTHLYCKKYQCSH